VTEGVDHHRHPRTTSSVGRQPAGDPLRVDRLLLTDLVNRTDVYDIPTWAGFELRQQFWAAVTAAIPDP
jgi:hypothetical protein